MAISFLQATNDITDLTTYTFASENLGTASSDRYIICGIIARKAGASTTIVSVTIGGVTATEVVQVTNTVTNSNVSGLFMANVPTGTTGDIVVEFGAGMVRCAIQTYAATGITPTPYDTGSSTAADPTFDLDIPDNGFAIGSGLTAASTTASWTGLTEDWENTLETFVTLSAAHDEFETGEVGRTITIDFASATESAGVFASWAYETAPVGRTLATGRTLASGRTLATGRTLASGRVLTI